MQMYAHPDFAVARCEAISVAGVVLVYFSFFKNRFKKKTGVQKLF